MHIYYMNKINVLVVGVTKGVSFQLEEIPEVSQREMSSNIFLIVHNTGTQSLLVCLSLENFFLYCPCLQ